MRQQILNQIATTFPIGGRRFTSEDLQLMLLSLIAVQPSHGYELIKAINTRSNGFYTPSPGMVYPALTYLEEIGLVSVATEGNRKRYSISDDGVAHLASHREQTDTIFAKLESAAGKMDSVRRAVAGEENLDEERSTWLPEFAKARQALKKALASRNVLPAEAQRRAAEILRWAADAIEQTSVSGDDATAPALEDKAGGSIEIAAKHAEIEHKGDVKNAD